MGYLQDELGEAVGKKWAKRFGVLGGLVVVYLIISSVFSIWPFSVAVGLAKKVVNENSIISNYEWYYDMYNQIQAQRINYDSMPSDAVEKDGLRMVLNQMIGSYNARSKEITRNLWKPKDIPQTIPLVTK
jgi:hypothetical protein